MRHSTWRSTALLNFLTWSRSIVCRCNTCLYWIWSVAGKERKWEGLENGVFVVVVKKKGWFVGHRRQREREEEEEKLLVKLWCYGYEAVLVREFYLEWLKKVQCLCRRSERGLRFERKEESVGWHVCYL